MTTEIAPITAATMAPTNWKELVVFADMMARSKAVPECYRGDPASVIYAVQMGAEVGLGPAQSLQAIANIDGQLRMWGDAPLALIRRSGLLEWIEEVDNFNRPADAPPTWQEPPEEQWWARCTMKRAGDPEPRTQIYTYADAKRAGLWGRESRTGKPMPWSTNPKRLMKYRARGFVSRDLFPDVLKGIAIHEEFGDNEPRNVTTSAPARGNAGLRETLGAQMGAAGIAPKPAPAPADAADPLMPDFESMVTEQIVEALDAEAHGRGVPSSAEARAIVQAALKGRRLSRATAPDAWRALHAWVAPAAEPEATAEASEDAPE